MISDELSCPFCPQTSGEANPAEDNTAWTGWKIEHVYACTRTIIEIENCKSNPKFETVALISKEMRISLDAVVFHDEKPREIPKVVADFFAGKSDAEAERDIALCQSAEKLKNGE